ncbi:MAG: hypothetical protein MRY74_09075 [Neomegalonema sp.]|nr:hypothetical protein [Neomegalonema sp.]
MKRLLTAAFIALPLGAMANDRAPVLPSPEAAPVAAKSVSSSKEAEAKAAPKAAAKAPAVVEPTVKRPAAIKSEAPKAGALKSDDAMARAESASKSNNVAAAPVLKKFGAHLQAWESAPSGKVIEKRAPVKGDKKLAAIGSGYAGAEMPSEKVMKQHLAANGASAKKPDVSPKKMEMMPKTWIAKAMGGMVGVATTMTSSMKVDTPPSAVAAAIETATIGALRKGAEHAKPTKMPTAAPAPEVWEFEGVKIPAH